MVTYHANVSPRSLTTTTDHLRQYPHTWELLKWYKCWRKYPYPSEIAASVVAEGRAAGGYRHYPCPLDRDHWHVGRGGNNADPRGLVPRAKRTYRKAVRDEIWRDYQEKQRVGIREGEASA